MSKIITLPQLKDINPGVNDAVGGLVVAAVNSWIETATSRCWGETRTVTELQNASGIVWLDHMDVVEVLSVTTGYPNSDPHTIDSNSYYVTPEGRLVLSRGRQTSLPPSTLDYLSIEYTYGVAEEDVPAALVLAGLGLATGYYEYVSNGGREVSRAQVGSYTLQFAAGSSDGSGSGALGSTVTRDTAVINSYAMRRV
ncbi:hypothetical protein [Rhodococcus sp. NPDC056516]|uniref:hypothetical protein n=1 Tax=Rhodococcus sp. NPDC056516 TaxID=3345847 RepID=UPI003672B770